MSTWAEFLQENDRLIPKEVSVVGMGDGTGLPEGSSLRDLPIITCPPRHFRFRAFSITPFESIKCVILGQDPYHTPGMATGLAFSVPFGERIPPSLQNIFKEYKSDLGYPTPRSGDLTLWADQGVFLLNTALSTIPGVAGAHTSLWHSFTSATIKKLSDEHSNLVFILWGRHAQAYAPLISVRGSNGHLILRASHPSPFSANSGFFGSRPFSKTNSFLTSKRKEPINWRLE